MPNTNAQTALAAALAVLDQQHPTSTHAYPQDHQHLLTQPSDPELGVSTTDDNGEW